MSTGIDAVPAGEMKRSLSLTGVTVNAMALIAPGAFLWTTFQLQAAQTAGGSSTAPDMWTGLVFALILALLTAYSYSELARIYPEAGTGSSYYFAEAALLDKASPGLRKWARPAKLTLGWVSHLYYWLYPGIMIAFVGTLFGYVYLTVGHHTLTYVPLAFVCVGFAALTGFIAYRGVSGSTLTAIVINVVQIVSLLAISVIFVVYRLGHGSKAYDLVNASKVVVPHSFMHVVYQSTIAILLLVGFESVTALGAEAKRPDKDIRRGILLSLLIQGGICYLVEYFAANFAVGGATIAAGTGKAATAGYAAAGNDSAPIGTMLKTVGDASLGHNGTSISLIVAVTVLLALIGTTLACLNTGVRVTYAMARDKEMPSILGLLHGDFATPHGGIWILTGFSALIGIYCVQPAQVDNITQVTLASNTGTFLVYGLTCLVTLVAFASRHDKHPVKHYVVPALGLLMNLGELAGVVYLAVKAGGNSATDAYKALAVVGAWIAAGLVWVLFNSWRKGHKLLPEAPKRTAGAPIEPEIESTPVGVS
jgi:APA family basic amino acid/polyamine antiporter